MNWKTNYSVFTLAAVCWSVISFALLHPFHDLIKTNSWCGSRWMTDNSVKWTENIKQQASWNAHQQTFMLLLLLPTLGPFFLLDVTPGSDYYSNNISTATQQRSVKLPCSSICADVRWATRMLHCLLCANLFLYSWWSHNNQNPIYNTFWQCLQTVSRPTLPMNRDLLHILVCFLFQVEKIFICLRLQVKSLKGRKY